MTTTTTTTTERLLDTIEAAEFLHLGKRTVQELVADRRLSCVRIGRAVRFDVADLRRFIEEQKRRSTGWKKTTPAQ
jgi:excisionase family DNA binding protein